MLSQQQQSEFEKLYSVASPEDRAALDAAVAALASEVQQKPWAAYAGDPLGYIKNILNINLTKHQTEIVLALIAPPNRVHVDSGHSLGKTALAACLVNYFYDSFPKCAIITTAPTYEHVSTRLWGEVRRLRREAKSRFPDLPMDLSPRAPEMRSSEDHFAVGCTASKGEALHGLHMEYMLFIFDESEGLEQMYFTTTSSMFVPGGKHLWLSLDNPVTLSSPAYLETRKVNGDGTPIWNLFRLTALEHPNVERGLAGLEPVIPGAVTAGQIDDWLVEYNCQQIEEREAQGCDFQWRGKWYHPGPMAESRILGLRPSQGTASVWTDSIWSAAETRDLSFPLGEMPEIGCDVARVAGGDDCDIHIRWGGISIKHESANGRPIPQTAARLKELAVWACDFANKVRQEAFDRNPQGQFKPFYEHQIPVKVDDGACGCLTPETEVLTVAGWVRADHISAGDVVFSKSKNDGSVVTESVLSNVIYPETEIVDSGQYAFSWSHVLPYKTRLEYEWKQTNWEKICESPNVWLDNEFIWRGVDTDFVIPSHSITMPRGGKRQYKPQRDIPGDDFCNFLGWFLSEGSVGGKRKIITITQSKDSGKQAIEDVLKRCGFHYCKSKHRGNCVGYVIKDQQLARWLLDNCYSGKKKSAATKKIPKYVKSQTGRRIAIFLESYVNGDGSRSKNGDRYYISSSSKVMIDDLQVLLMKSGGYGTVSLVSAAGSQAKIDDRILTRKHDNYRLTSWSQKRIVHQPKFVSKRRGDVHNIKISGESKLFMVRFADSRPFWVHNGAIIDLRGVFNFIPVSAASINQEEKYPNLRSELWFELAERARLGGLSLKYLIKHDRASVAKLKLQAMAPLWAMDARQRRVVEKKELTHKRLNSSPDAMDAMNLAYYHTGGSVASMIGKPLTDRYTETMGSKLGILGRHGGPDDEEARYLRGDRDRKPIRTLGR